MAIKRASLMRNYGLDGETALCNRGEMPSLAFRLRLFWYRLDKEAGIAALVFGLILGGLGFVTHSVYASRQEGLRKLGEFHTQNITCLARNIYHEARGEPLDGQYAVAEVTMNRKASPFYPKTVCEVVYQREAFSWTGLGPLEAPGGQAWLRAQKVAEEVYYQRRPATMHGVTHFHATYVKPDWAQEKQRVARIGAHIFYR
jgi:N-acetylmuramoyl-L-alanine amidase